MDRKDGLRYNYPRNQTKDSWFTFTVFRESTDRHMKDEIPSFIDSRSHVLFNRKEAGIPNRAPQED